MRVVYIQRFTYYIVLGVMAYLSLAYYIHHKVQAPAVYQIVSDHNSINTVTPFVVAKAGSGERSRIKSEESTITEYPNYYGSDFHFSSDGISSQDEDNTTVINFDEIKFKSVIFRKIQQIYVYSAFLDRRIANKTYVRILAVQKKNDHERILCGFLNGSDNEIITIRTEKYEMCENHGKRYGGYIYSCVVPSFVKSMDTVFLSTYTTFLEITPHYMNMDVMSKHKTNIDIGKMFFGVCLPPIFGHIALNIIVQYIELTKLLGGSKLFFYKYTVSQGVEKLLKYYTARGDVEVIQWNLPKDISDNDIWYHGQLLALQDCLYRNMYNFQFLLFADLDELLIPRQTSNWITMLHNIGINSGMNLSSVAGFSFQSVFFDPKQVPDPDQTLHFLQQLDRTKTSSSVRTKLLVQPINVFELGIHHLSKPIRENLTVVNVNPHDALLHHYRQCVQTFDINMHCFPEERDETILKYAPLLSKRTASVMSYMTKLLH